METKVTHSVKPKASTLYKFRVDFMDLSDLKKKTIKKIYVC